MISRLINPLECFLDMKDHAALDSNPLEKDTIQYYYQGSYKKQDLKIKDFSRTFQHLIILFQDHFIFIKSAFNIAMQKWVLRKQDTL